MTEKSNWVPREAVRVKAQVGTRAVDDGFVHWASADDVHASTTFRIIRCQSALVTRDSGWVPVDEPVDCLLCIANDGDDTKFTW